MSMPSLVVVSGPPGSGKTTLSRRLGDALYLPVVCRDAIKEGGSYSQSGATVSSDTADAGRYFDLFYEIVDLHLARGVSVVAEAAFRADVAPAELAKRARSARLVVVRCATADDVWLARFRSRAPREGHRDHEFIARVEAGGGPSGEVYHVTLPGVPTVDVDTTDGYQPSVERVVDFIRNATRL